MRTHEHSRMLTKSILYCIILLATLPVAAGADDEPAKAATDLLEKIRRSDHFTLYIVTRTEKYSLSVDEIKSSSSIKIDRKCGANCTNVMSQVISHLKHSTQTQCQNDQQNILIEIGDIGEITYSHSGRMINFDGRCFFNKKSINNVIENSNFIFN